MGWGAKIAGNLVGGKILKWVSPGQEIDGVFLGLRPGKPYKVGQESWLADMRLADGSISTLPAKTVLKGQLDQVKAGTRILVKYLGKVRGKGEQEYHNFEVTPWLEDGAVQPAVVAPPVQSVAADVPPAGQKPGLDFDTLTAILIAAKGDDAGKAITAAIKGMGGDPTERMRKTLTAMGVSF